MSVHADGLMKKAHTQMKENYKQTGFYETNAERVKRESKLSKAISQFSPEPFKWAKLPSI